MDTELVIATNNQGKLAEIKMLLPGIELLSLSDIGFITEIPEPFHSFEENALAKASAVYQFSGKNTLADDSGLCVNFLHGLPGVGSAHYSGERNDEKNAQKLLSKLNNATDRSAFYKAVICLVWDNEVYYFEGICEGSITNEKRGNNGFGYDPVFIPNGYEQTFGELPVAIKNNISHRGKALRKAIDFLKEKNEILSRG